MLSSKWWNNKASDIKLVYLHSTIKNWIFPAVEWRKFSRAVTFRICIWELPASINGQENPLFQYFSWFLLVSPSQSWDSASTAHQGPLPNNFHNSCNALPFARYAIWATDNCRYITQQHAVILRVYPRMTCTLMCPILWTVNLHSLPCSGRPQTADAETRP